MGKNTITFIAMAMLAVFALPACAMNGNMPPLPEDNMTPMLGAAPTGEDPGMPPMPGERPQMNGMPLNRFNGTAPGNNMTIPPVGRVQAIRDRIMNATNGLIREIINASNVRALVAQRVDEFNDARHAAVARPINNTQDTQSFILKAKEFANTLNQTQRQQFNQLVFGFLNQSMDNRIDVALRFGVKGAGNATVEAFLNNYEDLKDQIAAANSTQERRRLVNQANREWAAFKKDVVREAARDRILNATAKAQGALDKINVIIANLTANGTDTAKLVNISARVQLRINAASEQNITLRQAEWRLAYARDGLAHLAAQVKRVVKAGTAEDLQDETEPAELAIDDAVEPESPAATPTPVANATATQ